MSLVLWSGGVDSTHVLYRLLRKDDVYFRVNDEIRALSIDIDRCSHNQQQIQARNTIKKILANKYQFKFDHIEVTVRHTGDMCPHGGLIQPVIWIPLATTFLKENEDLYVGYIQQDDYYHHLTEAKKIFQGCMEMMCKTGKLKDPLEWWRKAEIIKYLRKEDKKILNSTWYCEEPRKNKPCGKCKPCITHRLALFELKTFRSKPVS